MKNYGDENLAPGGEIINADIEHGTSDPSPSDIGRIFFRTDLDALRVYDGSVWKSLVSGTVVSSFSASSTGLTPSSATTGAVTLGGTLNLTSGGTNASLTATAGGIVYGTGTALAVSSAGTAGQIILAGGTTSPTFLTNDTPVDTDGVGTVPLVIGAEFDVFGAAYQILTTSIVGPPAGVMISLSSSLVAPGSVEVTTTLQVDSNTASSFLYSNSNKQVVSTAAPTNGQLLIGSTGSVPVAAALTAGTAISISNGAGSITIANTGVTAVAGTTNRLTTTGSTGSITLDISGSYVGQSSITTLGTIGTGTWHGSTVDAIYGGTGQSSYTVGDILFADTTTTL